MANISRLQICTYLSRECLEILLTVTRGAAFVLICANSQSIVKKSPFDTRIFWGKDARIGALTMKIFTIDGNNFSDLNGFYDEIDKILTKDLGWKTGHNLNAYNDLLRGGFGVHEYEEPIVLRWLNYEKSKRELGDELMLIILEITLNCNNSGHDCKLELY